MRPVIGVTPDEGTTVARQGRPSASRYELKRASTQAISEAGGLPIILPYIESEEEIQHAAGLIAGLVVTGGAFDIDPAEYGHRPHPKLGVINRTRTRFERKILEAALERRIPVLAICGGMQLLNVVRGGNLVQDIASERPRAAGHEQPNDPKEPAHSIAIERNTLLSRLCGASMQVNSTHHQAIAELGNRLIVSARSPDGIIEAIEDPAEKFVLGVQWHPEILADDQDRAIHAAFVAAASG